MGLLCKKNIKKKRNTNSLPSATTTMKIIVMPTWLRALGRLRLRSKKLMVKNLISILKSKLSRRIRIQLKTQMRSLCFLIKKRKIFIKVLRI